MTKGRNIDKIKKVWDWIWNDDSFLSYIAFLLFAIIFLKLIFFPVLSFAFHTDFPIVAIVSGSMEHKIVDYKICDKYVSQVPKKSVKIDEFWSLCGDYYEKNYKINIEEFKEYPYENGLNTGDVMIVFGKKTENINIGNVIIFEPQSRAFFEQKGPVIHRVVQKWEENSTWYFRTKGDHNPSSQEHFENKIHEDKVIGVAVLRIPYIGLVKVAMSKVYFAIVS